MFLPARWRNESFSAKKIPFILRPFGYAQGRPFGGVYPERGIEGIRASSELALSQSQGRTQRNKMAKKFRFVLAPLFIRHNLGNFCAL